MLERVITMFYKTLGSESYQLGRDSLLNAYDQAKKQVQALSIQVEHGNVGEAEIRA
jgi:hypothetical protein